MILRSGRFTGIDYASIDFDHSSNEWMKNKIKLTNGTFKYKKRSN